MMPVIFKRFVGPKLLKIAPDIGSEYEVAAFLRVGR
jgi:hypothetical protein